MEEYDKAPHGKYTIGLGQTNMSFIDDKEDINSICLTVLDKLIKKTNFIKPNFKNKSRNWNNYRQIKICGNISNGII